MRDFSWTVFEATGSIESYLLYKEYERLLAEDGEMATSAEEEWMER